MLQEPSNHIATKNFGFNDSLGVASLISGRNQFSFLSTLND